eukprot:1521024-Rhodomonas_salina.3
MMLWRRECDLPLLQIQRLPPGSCLRLSATPYSVLKWLIGYGVPSSSPRLSATPCPVLIVSHGTSGAPGTKMCSTELAYACNMRYRHSV